MADVNHHQTDTTSKIVRCANSDAGFQMEGDRMVSAAADVQDAGGASGFGR
jgi:hypothetical protein